MKFIFRLFYLEVIYLGQVDAAKKFATDWNAGGNEDSHKQTFWLDLLRKIFGIEDSGQFIKFEKSVSFNKHTHKIDGYISHTKVLIEHKSFPNDLSAKYLQSDGTFLTPLEQALRYAEHLPYNEFPRWIVTCNFKEFQIYYFGDILSYFNPPAPIIIKLEDLPDEFPRLNFLVDPDDTTILEDVNISKSALDIIKNVRDDLQDIYIKNHVNDWQNFLYKICVRLVFCFYADDSRLFDDDKYFAAYLQNFKGNEQIKALQNIFDVLNTPYDMRGNFDDDLKKFPYVNGGLFDEKITLPNLKGYHTTPIDNAFLKNINFHWENINPTIFGAMFESALSPNERRKGGMHYTSIENIHKVIDPLFLEDLHKQFRSAKLSHKKNRLQKLKDFQNKLANLTFFDPACGSGNFLTETYLSIRKLENETIREMKKISNLFDENPVKVSINNFYGIEIHGYAVAVAKVAMWIAENQMLHKTEKIINRDLIKLPLKNYPNIICANALQTDWADFVPRDNLNFIIGNPPFVGGMMTTDAQKFDMQYIWGNIKYVGEMDYVSAWYKKTWEFIKNTKIESAFVSTNSIVQGQQATTVWKPLINSGLNINFAHKTFKWQSESDDMAAVHCVIISFAKKSRRKKFIYDGENKIPAQFINSYLLNAPQVFIDYRSNPICDVPPMHFGSMPRDGKKLIINAADIELFQKNVPEKFIRLYLGAEEFINGKKRWCLWLKDFESEEFMKYPLIAERVDAVKNFRLNSKAKATQKFAETPHLFCQIAQPDTNYILVPSVSSENRRYIPMDYLKPEVIASNACFTIPNANLFHFGVLTSSVHMAWMRTVCGRLKSDYRYSKDIVYNNFVWCEYDSAIEKTAAKILEVRAGYEGKTLAFLYNESTMPEDLRLAHLENDAAVKSAYGFENLSEEEIVSALMILYKNLTEK